MPTHGHGQGYSDLNILIPELVDRIEYRKGPDFVKSGDFALAGSADIEPGLQLLGAAEQQRNDVSSGSGVQGWGASLMGYDARWTSTPPGQAGGACRDRTAGSP